MENIIYLINRNYNLKTLMNKLVDVLFFINGKPYLNIGNIVASVADLTDIILLEQIIVKVHQPPTTITIIEFYIFYGHKILHQNKGTRFYLYYRPRPHDPWSALDSLDFSAPQF